MAELGDASMSGIAYLSISGVASEGGWRGRSGWLREVWLREVWCLLAVLPQWVVGTREE